MNVKTITAPSIHAALIEARRVLGDDVVLMESIPAKGGEPARITVMADTPDRMASNTAGEHVRHPSTNRSATRAASSPESTLRQPGAQNSGDGRSSGGTHPHAVAQAQNSRSVAKGGSGYGYSNPGAEVAVLPEENARTLEALSVHAGPSGESDDSSKKDYGFEVGGRTLRDLAGEASGTADVTRRTENLPEPRVDPIRRGITGPAGRGSLYPNRNTTAGGSNVPAPHDPMAAIENLLVAQLQLLHERLDKIERRFDGAIIGAGQAWTANPLFASMLKQGMRPATLTKIFDNLAQKGYQPDTNPETLKWAVAQEIRRSLDLSAPKQNAGAQVFIGPSGAGKTSLLLKLAAHPGFFGRRETSVIVIEPEDEDTAFHQSPIDTFRRHGLPVQAVRTVDEMRRAVIRVQHFDHILIDTPPMPLNEAAARTVLRHVKKLVDPIMPLRVQFVLNATRSLEDFNSAFIHELPLRPEMVALTHLDETGGWGRIAEWLMAVRMPVQFVSTGASVPDSVTSFSPSWFVEEMMKL